jgi:hypothetical protein
MLEAVTARLRVQSKVFLNLSKHFKEQSKTWLAEDKAAQQTRHKNPDAMDIYDTSKTEGMAFIFKSSMLSSLGLYYI